MFLPRYGSGFPTDAFSIAVLSLYFLILTVSIGGALSLLVLPLNDSQRGIMSMFVTVCAFFPLVLLWFQALYWIVQFWLFAIVAFVWIGLIFMAIRATHPRLGR